MRFPPALRTGEHVRLTEGPTWHEVVRVTPGAAYVRALYTTPREVIITDKNGETRTFKASHGTGIEAISVHSFVYERRVP